MQAFSTLTETGRRRHARVPSSERVTVLPADGVFLFCRYVDRSIGGACVELPAPIEYEPGRRMEILDLPAPSPGWAIAPTGRRGRVAVVVACTPAHRLLHLCFEPLLPGEAEATLTEAQRAAGRRLHS